MDLSDVLGNLYDGGAAPAEGDDAPVDRAAELRARQLLAEESRGDGVLETPAEPAATKPNPAFPAGNLVWSFSDDDLLPSRPRKRR
jgi:hypothetical protein